MSATELPDARALPVEAGIPAGAAGRPRALPGAGALTAQRLALMAVIGLGFLLRLVASVRLTPHIDEAASVLAAHATATQGWPLFPSGTVYFQGATLSWLLTPLVWMGLGDLDQLEVLRFPLVVAGTLTVYLCYRLGLAVLGDRWIAIVMAGLVAIDPVSVQWSGHVRMYALLQALTVALALAMVPLLGPAGPAAPPAPARPSWPRGVLVVALFWLAVFTHVGASLLLVAMGLAFLLVMRSGLWRRLDLVAMLGLCALAPVTLVVLNQVLGTASVTSSGAASRPWTFVGDNLLQPLAILERGPSVDSWEGLGRTWLIPGLIVGVSTVLAGWHLLWREPGPARRLVLGLLCLYWVPVVAIGLFTVSPKERYFLHVHTLGYLFVAWLLVRTAQRDGGSTRAGRASPGLAVTIAIGVALVLRLAHPVVHPDYHAAMAWVATHQQPGEPIVVARPPAAWLTLEPARRGDLVYLAGGEDQPWERRYTRYGPAGDLVDYWVGIDAIVSADELRRFLEANPDAWIVLDEGHLVAEWAYGGEIERVLRDTTSIVQRTPGGGLVLRPA